MNKITLYLPLVVLIAALCGCGMHTPPLPPLNKESFSYDQVMQQKKQLEQEISQETH